MNPKNVIFKIGPTFSGLPFYLGIILIGLGIALLSLYSSPLVFVPTIILVGVGLLLLFSIQSLEIDSSKKVAIKKLNLLLSSIPLKKTQLNSFDQVYITLYTDNQTMNMASISATVRTKSYDIYLSNKNHKILLLEITDYEKAKKLITEIGQALNIVAIDKYAEFRKAARTKYNMRK